MARAGKPPGLALVPALADAARPELAADDDRIAIPADGLAAALRHGPAAIGVLLHLMNNATSEASRIAAANAMLDRAYGKARVGTPPAAAPRQVRLTVVFV